MRKQPAPCFARDQVWPATFHALELGRLSYVDLQAPARCGAVPAGCWAEISTTITNSAAEGIHFCDACFPRATAARPDGRTQ